MTDSPKEVKTKINKYALSGGGMTIEEHREKGGNVEVDVPFQYLTFFLEDDEKLAEIKAKYTSGEMLTGEIKAILIDVVNEFLKDFQEKRAKVTDEDVKLFMSVRKISPMPEKLIRRKEAAKQEESAKKAAEEQKQ